MRIPTERNGETPRNGAPFVLRWSQTANPLPRRLFRTPFRLPALPFGLDAPPWLPTGPTDQPFDFCGHLQRLCASIVTRCDELHHVDLSQVLLGVFPARNNRKHGLQARVTPLRFRGGLLHRNRRGVPYQVQRWFVDGREILYVMTFCLPRFLNQNFDDKLITLFHELYHLSPAFDGDLRRLTGRCSLHSRRQKDYDAHMASLARGYLANGADPNLHAFLRLNFVQLLQRHGGVVGVVVPRPKVIPVPPLGP